MEVRGLRMDGFPNNPLTRPLPSHRGLPQQSSPQQLLNLQGTPSASLLNGSMLQRALLLQQLQGMAVLSSPHSVFPVHTVTLSILMGRY